MQISNVPNNEIAGDSIFWSFFVHNPTPMWLYNAQSLQFVCVNPSAIAIYGYSEDEFLQLSIRDIRPQEDVARLEGYVKDIQGSLAEDVVWRHLKKNGNCIWVKVTSFEAQYGGVPVRVVTAVDVTENYQQSIALRRANIELERLSMVAKLTANAVMLLDKDRRILWVNDAFTRMNGYTLDEARGWRPSELLHGPRSSQETGLFIKQSIEAGRPFSVEIVHYTKEGKEIWVLVDGQPIPGQHPDAEAQVVIVETDITQLKEQAASIERAERQMSAFFDGTQSLHILFDTDFKVITYNEVASDFCERFLLRGLEPGISMLDVISDATRSRFIHFAKEAIEGRPTINREAEIPLDTARGSVWWVISDIPAYDSFGNIMGVAFTAFDITERKKNEEKIKRQNRVFNDIAWKQSHLVRLPLTNILSIINLMKEGSPNGELVPALDTESKKLDKIITDIVYKTLEARDV